MRRRSYSLILAIASPLLALAACDNTTSLVAVNGSGSARLTVQLTDAPADLAEAWVRVKKVQLIGGDSAAPDTTAADTTKSSTLSVDSGWVNLLALQDGKTKSLFSGDVKAGTFSQVRLIVCDMYIKTTDDEIIATPGAVLPADVTPTAGTELKLTSQCQSGFKVVLRGGMKLSADNASTLTIDFDAKRSFAHQAGKSGKWIVTPVLFGSVAAGNGTTGTGSIAGNVVLDTTIKFVKCGGDSLLPDSLRRKFVPTAKGAAPDTTVHSGTTTAAGAFTIANLAPATYTLGADKLGFANGDTLTYTFAATPATVAVTASTTPAAANYGVSALTCKPHA